MLHVHTTACISCGRFCWLACINGTSCVAWRSRLMLALLLLFYQCIDNSLCPWLIAEHTNSTRAWGYVNSFNENFFAVNARTARGDARTQGSTAQVNDSPLWLTLAVIPQGEKYRLNYPERPVIALLPKCNKKNFAIKVQNCVRVRYSSNVADE